MAQLTFPDNPSSGEIYTAENGITYRYDDTAFPGGVGVWLVDVPSAALSVTSGSIAGATTVGSVLTYTQGVASGGTPTYSYTQQWYRDGAVIPGATLLNYTVAAADLGKALTVTITATDSATPTPAQATATTAPFNIPAPSVLTITSPGTITGTAASGSTLTYSPGSATGGTGTINYTWVWKKASDNSVLQSPGTTTYQIPLSLVGDNVYVTLTATDSATPTPAQASADTPDYPASGTITATPFPGLTFSPSTGPTAAPASVNAGALQGTATATWPSTPSPATLTLTGDIQISIAGSPFQGAAGNPFSISSGQSIAVIWDPTAVANAAHNATLTGAIEDATYKTTFSMVVSRSPVWPASPPFADLDPEPLTTVKTSNTVAPTGFNVPVTLTVAGTVSNPLGSFGAAVAPGGFGSAPQPVNPGQTIQLQGTTGGAINTTYGMTVSLGSATGTPATDTWTVKTVTGLPTVTTPQILTPNAGTTGQGTAAGITITSDPFASSNGAGTTHTSSDWQLYANSYPLTSTNAITTTSAVSANWTNRTTGWATPQTVQSVVYGGGRYVIGGIGTVATSTDGVSWTPYTSGINANDNNTGLAYGNGTYVAVGFQAPTNTGIISTSTTGASWTPQTTSFGATAVNTVTFGNNLFVAVGEAGKIATSPDGVAWTQQTSGFGADNILNVTYANSLFVAVGGNGKIATSSNGTVWTQRTSGFGTDAVFDVTYGGGLFVAVGANGKIATSPDGTNWTQRTSGVAGAILSCTYGNGVFVVGSFTTGPITGIVLTSVDGINWTSQTLVMPSGASTLGFGNGLFLVGGSDPTLLTATIPAAGTSLNIAGADTDGFLVGDTIVSVPAAAGPAVITALNSTSVTVVPQSASWAAPQKISRATSMYNLAASATADTINLVSWPVAKPPLAANTTYYTRVRYTSSAIITTSDWSPWRKFTTGALTPAIGALYGGGYFAGQINDGGTVYNLVVAPVLGDVTGPNPAGTLQGQRGGATPTGILYKTSASADLVADQNVVYGGTTSDRLKASGVHPLFNTTWLSSSTGPNGGVINIATGGAGGGSGIGGYTDWYVPAKNELEVLYYYLKPNVTSGGNANSTIHGSNPNAVAPEPISTNYTATNPAQTTASLFQGTNAQAFSTAGAYWSSSEASSNTACAWRQDFANGQQNFPNKDGNNFARAIRRVQA